MTTRLSVSALQSQINRQTYVIGSSARIHQITPYLNLEAAVFSPAKPVDVSLVVAIGGGSVIDQAKHFRSVEMPEATLVAIPSVWGSGAEVSPVVVLNDDFGKRIQVDEKFRPDHFVDLPQLGLTLDSNSQKYACGDTFSHALEAILSPLASDSVRTRLAQVIKTITNLPFEYDEEWFSVSRDACGLQAQAGVGLVHGIAHTIERSMQNAFPAEDWGHARLCSLFLLPVMAFNQENSEKFTEVLERYSISPGLVREKIAELFDMESYERTIPFLQEAWFDVLREPCSRVNCTVVRRNDISWFAKWSYP